MRARTPAIVALTAALTLAACGGDDTPAATPAAGDASTAASGEMSDTTGEMTESSGEMSESSGEMSESTGEMTDTTGEMSESTGEMSDTTGEMSSGEMSEDVLMTAMQRDDLTTFIAAVEASGLDATLHGSGPYTIFAPTNAAFLAYLGEMGMSADEALAAPDALRTLLEHHVVEGDDDAEMVMGMAGRSFTTVGGDELAVTVDGDTVMVGEATIVEYDLRAANGIIHVVDQVLAP